MARYRRGCISLFYIICLDYMKKLMSDPSRPGKSGGQLCKICGKPVREHSFQEQQKCAEKLGADDK